MSAQAPGSYCPSEDHWGPFQKRVQRLPPRSLVVVDKKVARLHPQLLPALKARDPLAVLQITGGEKAKSFQTLEPVLAAGLALPRSGTLLCIGGGTLGDLCTVAAHLIKRGVRLVQVPSTVLAAVDSSVGGKGAVDLEIKGQRVKNPAGVFHYASEAWLCPELFVTLTPAQRREGALEAWKMMLCLDAKAYGRARRKATSLEKLIRDARALKEGICQQDPYEQKGLREVLNFGHTFGHVLESVSQYRVAHGDAVGLGMLCALDVGKRLGVTDASLSSEVEATLSAGPGLLGRAQMKRYFAKTSEQDLHRLLTADKKAGPDGTLRMVLLKDVGSWELRRVEAETWKPLLSSWARGEKA